MVTPSKSIYTAQQALEWLVSIAEALAYMHSLDPTVCMTSYAASAPLTTSQASCNDMCLRLMFSSCTPAVA